MQSKKQVNNPEAPLFNIRKVNKKIVAPGSNLFSNNGRNDEPFDMEFKNYSSVNKINDKRKQKQILLDQSVNQAITNSKVYTELKRSYIQNKKINAQNKKHLEQVIELRKKQKFEAQEESEKLEKQKQIFIQAIKEIKQKIQMVRESNQKYRHALSARMSGQAQYISNIIMSMRFQAEYEHGIDPDQMTYQQLLQLEQKIGSVSKGLPAQLIKTLPKIQVVQVSQQKCTVCFSNYEIGEVSTAIPNCKHQFHFQCLQSWLAKQKVCPICKQEIVIKIENQQ